MNKTNNLARILILAFVALVANFTQAASSPVSYVWDPSPDLNVTYKVFYGQAPGSYQWTTNTSATNVVLNLESTNTYYAAVVAVDIGSGLESDLSNEAILFSGPDGFILVSAIKKQSVSLTWNQSTNPAVSKYYVYYGKSTNIVDRLKAEVSAPTNTITLTVPAGTSTLYCRLVASVGPEFSSSGGFTNASWSAKLSLKWPEKAGGFRLQ